MLGKHWILLLTTAVTMTAGLECAAADGYIVHAKADDGRTVGISVVAQDTGWG
jgi:hypothetical protein